MWSTDATAHERHIIFRFHVSNKIYTFTFTHSYSTDKDLPKFQNAYSNDYMNFEKILSRVRGIHSVWKQTQFEFDIPGAHVLEIRKVKPLDIYSRKYRYEC